MVSLQVESLDQSISWYKEMLGFEMDNRYTFVKQKTKIAVLKLNDFYIELIQNQSTASGDQIRLLHNTVCCGFYKMGFLVNDLNVFYQELKQEHPDQLNGIIDSEVSGYTYFDLYDPDSTHIQIIASSKPKESREIRPYLIGITVTDMESEITWYEQNLYFTFTRKWEVSEEGIYVRQLYSDGFIIELQKERTNPGLATEAKTSGEKEDATGISKMTFRTDNLQALSESLKANHTTLLQEITPKSSAWYTSFLVTEDAENNTIQIIQ
jgi:catechol 2,3-dioxygenase-like lactoylglutathione lyase family enzyme/predicted enzyme related to lactoylglutathione lyase